MQTEELINLKRWTATAEQISDKLQKHPAEVSQTASFTNESMSFTNEQRLWNSGVASGDEFHRLTKSSTSFTNGCTISTSNGFTSITNYGFDRLHGHHEELQELHEQ
jgi:hypothetical protein